MTLKDTKEQVRFSIRMKKDLYEKLKSSAKKDKRSIAKEIEFFIETTLEQ